MIRRLRLTAWKAFDELDVALQGGTSFIVARNGVGKTSLLQAIHFGLFGDPVLLGSGTAVERAVRGGANVTASVMLDVDLDGRTWNVERLVRGTRGKRESLPPPQVTVDGDEARPGDWQQALEAASGVGMTELRLLSAIGEGATPQLQSGTSAQRYDIIRHLSHALGVSRLQDSAKKLEVLAKRTSTEADRDRLAIRDRPLKVAAAEQTTLSERQATLAQQLAVVRAELLQARQHQASQAAWRDWRRARDEVKAELRARSSEITTALQEASRLLPPDVIDTLAVTGPAAPDEREDEYQHGQRESDRVSRVLDELRGAREALLEVVGAHRARIEVASTALNLLDEASEPLCPTCRQPLAADAAANARREHIRSRDEAASKLASAEAVRASIDTVEIMLRRVRRPMPVSPTPPSVPEADDASQVSDEHVERLQQEEARLDNDVRDVRARIRHVDTEATARQADAELEQRLVVQYGQADLATLAAGTMTRLASQICAERIVPLASALEKRWQQLWPGRPALRLDVATGEMLGEVAGSRIDLPDLSGGERAVANVLLRLLALQVASTCPVLLLDEPLEHLDPRNRRMLASLLVAATRSASVPRQVLVTTYEESVTRRLAGAVPGTLNSHVVYVGPDVSEG